LKQLQINLVTWEYLAQDRPAWRRSVTTCSAIYKVNRIAAEAEAKRAARKSAAPRTNTVDAQALPTCPRCRRTFHPRIGLFGHLRTLCNNNPTTSTSVTPALDPMMTKTTSTTDNNFIDVPPPTITDAILPPPPPLRRSRRRSPIAPLPSPQLQRQALEDRHADLEYELRTILAKQVYQGLLLNIVALRGRNHKLKALVFSSKLRDFGLHRLTKIGFEHLRTTEERAREDELLKMLVDIVEERTKLVEVQVSSGD
uniref:C2H2-type domain-containing protein n=1 Tax=Schistocephalus solidus TaxID=70667 RepID=A0A183TBR5_SCHSO